MMEPFYFFNRCPFESHLKCDMFRPVGHSPNNIPYVKCCSNKKRLNFSLSESFAGGQAAIGNIILIDLVSVFISKLQEISRVIINTLAAKALLTQQKIPLNEVTIQL